MTQPGSFSNIVPAGEDWIGRRLADIERRIGEMSSTLSVQIASVNAIQYDIVQQTTDQQICHVDVTVPRGFTRAQIFAVGSITATRSPSTTSGFLTIGLLAATEYATQNTMQDFPTPDAACTLNVAYARSFTGLQNTFRISAYGSADPKVAWSPGGWAQIVGQVVFLR